MTEDMAQVLALRALGWLARDEELLGTFLAATGADLQSLRRSAGSIGALTSCLDFVLMRDDWTLACAAAIDAAPTDIGTARAVLGGGDRANWT